MTKTQTFSKQATDPNLGLQASIRKTPKTHGSVAAHWGALATWPKASASSTLSAKPVDLSSRQVVSDDSGFPLDKSKVFINRPVGPKETMPVAPWQNWTSLSSGDSKEVSDKGPCKIIPKIMVPNQAALRPLRYQEMKERCHCWSGSPGWCQHDPWTPESCKETKRRQKQKKPSQMQAVATFTKCSHHPRPCPSTSSRCSKPDQ